MYRPRKIAAINRVAHVRRASVAGLAREIDSRAERYREFQRGVRRGSKRACRHTSHVCRICPVNWDCRVLKDERVRLGWGEDE